MSDAEDFTADLLAGRRNHIDDKAPRSPGARGTTSEIMQQARDSIADLEALRAQDKQEALRVFRALLMNDSLTETDFDQFMEVWRLAITDPDEFREQVKQQPQRGPLSWLDNLRAWLHRPQKPSAEEQKVLDEMKKIYVFPDHPLAPAVNPHERLFEIPDPAWVPLAKVKLGERDWPKGLVDMPRHSAAQPYVYPALDAKDKPLAEGVAHEIALLADFGTGYYHSWGIAQQLAAWSLPYTFHLGDVYYAGRPDEFLNRFELPLFEVVERTRFMGLAENHELYAGGQPYLRYFQKLHARKRTQQEGTYFCVRFPHHQIVAIDVNWQGRQRYTDPLLKEWFQQRLAEAGDRTTILLTGSAPFLHGSPRERALHTDLIEYLGGGAVGLWFWGDDHYCALFDRKDPEVPFYGSCIGHGGFPGDKVTQWRASYTTSPLWVEDLARFPTWSRFRQDMTNNGWCHLTLQPDGGVDLLYVDWLWCKRAAVSFQRDGRGLRRNGDVKTFDRDAAPEIHRP